MTRKKQINKACEQFLADKPKWYYSTKTEENIAQASFVMGAKWADEHPKSPWISVDKKLPRKLQNKDYSKEVLCRTEGGTLLVSIYNHKKREWIDGIFIKIAHWMPIP